MYIKNIELKKKKCISSYLSYILAAHVMYYYFKQLNTILSKIKPDEKLKFIILKEQCQSLLAVINSLNLVNEKSRYLMIKYENNSEEYNNVNN